MSVENCPCVACYETSIREILGNSLVTYYSFFYSYLKAKCPECEKTNCHKAKDHRNICKEN